VKPARSTSGDGGSVRVGVLSLHDSKETKAILSAVGDLGHGGVRLRRENTAVSVRDGAVTTEPEVDDGRVDELAATLGDSRRPDRDGADRRAPDGRLRRGGGRLGHHRVDTGPGEVRHRRGADEHRHVAGRRGRCRPDQEHGAGDTGGGPEQQE